MHDLGLTIRHGTVVTAADTFHCDIGIKGGRIVAMSEHLPAGSRDIDASGRLVLPGGMDSHCHVEQLSSMGVMGADDFYSATVSAAFGGTTTIIPFAAQHRGHTIKQTVDDYTERARTKAVIDYGFHLIISDPSADVLGRELPEYIRTGITSLKVYTTYDRLRLDDAQVLEVLALADREGALVMVHAENHEMIRWIATHLLDRGHEAPSFHATSHSALAESEATNRVIQLSRLLEVPLLIVHVSTTEAVRTIRTAQTLGVRIYAETCPQYLFLSAADIDRPGLEGAKFCCSPPPRDEESQEALWGGLANGTFQLFSSDHSPYRFDASGKLPKGEKTTFKDTANGVPGIEVRLPLLFSEGVLKSRITINEFVALAATNHAKMYGLHPRKGTLAIGSDGDVAIWDPEKEVTIRPAALHDNVGYTPYEGRVVKGWPETVISRGRIVVAGGSLQVECGSGVFLPCGRPGPIAWGRKPSPATEWFKSLIG
ncbi:MAG: dihydropyrimidinase [candidate division NC10 bacterium RIFCSPLOWO2_02_FULL_66_22]|nr:MAG: dihydropyrimidinase [candidate division NC10 bacterium RIFCSPLOWO2_02_FULL_66_22]